MVGSEVVVAEGKERVGRLVRCVYVVVWVIQVLEVEEVGRRGPVVEDGVWP